MAWSVTTYSKKAVMRAGEKLIVPTITAEERLNAMDVLSNWRAAHAYPMQAVLMLLRKKSTEVDSNAIVVQRLKRTPSIVGKLSRYPDMKLHRMQDISGCRSIVTSVSSVEKLAVNLKDSQTRHQLHKLDDYIKEPKDSGYRGIHLIYKYGGVKKEYEDYFVEIQLRSKIQHAWATAVEIIDTFTTQALKSSSGDKEWMDFFCYASAEFAKLEKRTVSVNLKNVDTLSALKQLAEKLNVVDLLDAFAISASHLTSKNVNKSDYFLLELSENAQKINAHQFTVSQLDKATNSYLEKEKRVQIDTSYDVVLVAASSMQALKRAYPNYFADSKDFLRYLDRILSSV